MKSKFIVMMVVIALGVISCTETEETVAGPVDDAVVAEPVDVAEEVVVAEPVDVAEEVVVAESVEDTEEVVVVEEPVADAPVEVAEVVAEVTEVEAADESAELTTDQQKVGYSIGTQIGADFKRNEIDISLDAFIRGFSQAYMGKDLALTETEVREILQAFSQRMQALQKAKMEEQKAKMAELAPKNAAEGEQFLEANKAKEGVVVLPSGLQYKVISEGEGDSPKATDVVKVNYRGTLIDGTEFDSSAKHGDKPAEFPVNRVIKGWTEGLQLMKKGAKWELYVPSDLAYGPQGPPNIGPNSTLIFEVELVDITKPAVRPMPKAAAPATPVAPAAPAAPVAPATPVK